MTANVSLPQSDQNADISFAQELASVRDKMYQPVHMLRSPLRELIRAQIDSSSPLTRAAVVLCAGFSREADATESRVNLAAALEMLAIALEIHEHLLDPERPALPADPSPEERTYLGGNILAGDFCFSCAAQLAARTESPAVVATFAKALQNVSENRLRMLFRHGNATNLDPSLSAHRILMRSGAAAALELSDLDSDDRMVVGDMVDILAGAGPPPPAAADGWQKHLGGLPAEHVNRWNAYARWMSDATPDSSSL